MSQKSKPKIGLLSRLFRRKEASNMAQNPVVAALYSTAIGRPLLVHPQIGENLVGAYLNGAVDAPLCVVDRFYLTDAKSKSWVRESTPMDHQGAPLLWDDDDSGADPAEEDADLIRLKEDSSFNVAVINISGGLIDRPMPGACGPGPTSYEALSSVFDRLVSDETVHAVVMRLDTPGGMASGLFDFTDRVFAARGKKPIWAVVSDMAYSAGYAIASVCDRIIVTRTGGVGSVGVVSYHEDWSEAHAKMGIKITAIYAGSHKVDFSPAFPLSPEAKSYEQAQIDVLYTLFCDRVATYRGMPMESVMATQALCFQGQQALDVGFATDLGTFDQALTWLVEDSTKTNDPPADPAPENEDPPAEDPPADDPPADDPPADPPADPPSDDEESKKAALDPRIVKAEELARQVEASNDAEKRDAYTGAVFHASRKAGTSFTSEVFAALTAGYASAKIEEVANRVLEAKEIVAICAIAKAPSQAAVFIKKGLSKDDVRKQLLDAGAEEDSAIRISPALAPKTTEGSKDHQVTLSTAAIYAARRAAANLANTRK